MEAAARSLATGKRDLQNCLCTVPRAEHQYCRYGCRRSVAQYPTQVGEDSSRVAGEHGAFQFNGVYKRQQVCSFFEHAAYKLQIKPDAGQPCGKVGEKRTA